MSDFFNSLKSDLLDRRFLPFLALLGVALVAAIAYAVLGAGGSSTSPTPPASSAPAAGTSAAVAITQAPASSNQAVAETTSGASQQHAGKARDPFTPLPGGAKQASSTGTGSTGSTKGSSSSSSSASSTSASSAPGSGKSTSSTGGSPTTTTTPKPTTPAKPRYYIHFHVTAQFGVVPPSVEGAPPAPAQLRTFPDMALNEPLPGKENPQVVYLGVVLSTGKDAVFGLTGEAILHGSATCKPSPTQCQAIELQAGQSETLEVLGSTGQPVTYELKLVSIAKSESSASAANAHAASLAQAKVDRNGALRRSGLRFSPGQGGLVYIGRPAFGAHAARRR
jgi:hypothetical protein